MLLVLINFFRNVTIINTIFAFADFPGGKLIRFLPVK